MQYVVNLSLPQASSEKLKIFYLVCGFHPPPPPSFLVVVMEMVGHARVRRRVKDFARFCCQLSG